ncbi:hypothetical protein BJ165DRAFT_1609994 [Panaeolus papilionaceus]|nr:hypothetical protein BJ165DRAFT_1609994 [Panaeolus papilionaceus]
MKVIHVAPGDSELNTGGPQPEAARETERDPTYFFENVFLRAEDRVFSVPKSELIRHGTYFQSLFRDEPADSPGRSEQHPIILDSVSKIHFHNFLRLIYPLRCVEPLSGAAHWLGILDLSTRWGFQDLRDTALTHLEPLFTSASSHCDVIYALHLCQKYNIQKHINHQYETLIASVTPLDRAVMLEGSLDEETILQVMEMREKWLCGFVWENRGNGTGILSCPRRLSARSIVEKHFSPTIAGVPQYSSATDSATERKWIQEEEARLSNSIKHVEKREGAMKKAVRGRPAKAMAEEGRKEEEKVEVKKEAEKLTRSVEDGARDWGHVEQREDVEKDSIPAGEDLDDIQSIISDTSILPSSNVRDRLTRLILLCADKYKVSKKIQELEIQSLGENNTMLEKLDDIVETLERKIETYLNSGYKYRTLTAMFGGMADLDTLDEIKSMQKIEETLEIEFGPETTSLSIQVCIGLGLKKPMSGKQKQATMDVFEYYGLLPYTVEDTQRRKLILTANVPETMFGEWLTKFKQLVSSRSED